MMSSLSLQFTTTRRTPTSVLYAKIYSGHTGVVHALAILAELRKDTKCTLHVNHDALCSRPPASPEASNSLQSYRDHKSGKYKDPPTLGAVRKIIYLNILLVKKRERTAA